MPLSNALRLRRAFAAKSPSKNKMHVTADNNSRSTRLHFSIPRAFPNDHAIVDLLLNASEQDTARLQQSQSMCCGLAAYARQLQQLDNSQVWANALCKERLQYSK